ncbi:CRISPR-associated protein Cmr6 [Caminicella sporogenes DSM 14501]|uniref:CRISPR-associated protein Cmr6 n=1 Tax=Caminicella sporogenes DSM 14501 TaxID=1121266 RepID=A0A1M6LSX5_9FIRM|nr:type III-B CRISPR module RAMP protein Cmr6 [Caminicella sporogenes]RKD27936.1 type III-B CRISPR module RAMP protein Cmr6 [Caminicella sporogenes]SHJ74186.1 CRISPR-associated protein Cmr6 [Caminicella sporogenes DSM 14501]
MAKKIEIIQKGKNQYEYIETKYNKYDKKIEDIRNYVYLQNLDYKYIENKNIKDINFNYILNNLFFMEEQKYEINRIYEIKEKENKITFNMEFNKVCIPEELKEYKENIVDYCKCMNLDIISKEFEIEIAGDKKLVIGLGHTNIGETSMTIHKVYGVPYIPGQVLKGIFKAYYIQEVMRDDDSLEKILQREDIKIKDKDLLYAILFGEKYSKKQKDKQAKSNIYFFDAYPKDDYSIQEDIMNVHPIIYYNEQAKENTQLNKSENLNLITFYVVKDTRFQVVLALDTLGIQRVLKDYNKDKKSDEKYVIEEIMENIYLSIVKIAQKAYSNMGIGAKTQVGYGDIKVNEKEILEEYEKNKRKN